MLKLFIVCVKNLNCPKDFPERLDIGFDKSDSSQITGKFVNNSEIGTDHVTSGPIRDLKRLHPMAQ